MMSVSGGIKWAVVACLGLAGAGCESLNITWSGYNETFTHGFVADGRIDKVKTGMDVQAVLNELGTPSTVSTVGNKTFYYITQRNRRTVQFLGEREVERQVFTVYFNQGFKVERIANYGLQDGQVFDFISRTTPTGGAEPSFVRNMLQGLGKWS
ncbi:outer membrane protein assembly factor BamE [Terrarubrum flagellatum]|uniref:outer membrane protein assembly factor BamE n=1 Tax=Terrirubrum flagellatum TaxID=2895980 RepID=UPI0031450DA5